MQDMWCELNRRCGRKHVLQKALFLQRTIVMILSLSFEGTTRNSLPEKFQVIFNELTVRHVVAHQLRHTTSAKSQILEP